MAEYVYERGELAVIVLRVPKRLWDHWEYRHRDFGKAVFALRETCIDIMAERSPASYVDLPDPFFSGD